MLKLRVRLTSNPNDDDDETSHTFWFQQEAGKKSSFLLEPSEASSLKIEKPCHLLIDCFPSSVTGSPWLFGGMEIFSNSRNLEVYAIPEGKDNEEYWQTYPGSRVKSFETDNDVNIAKCEPKDTCENEIYQTTILPPSSKPETVIRLHLKLLSLRPARCLLGFVKSMKLKARLPDVVESISIPVKNEVLEDDKVITNIEEVTFKGAPGQTSITQQRSQQNRSSRVAIAEIDPTEKISSAVMGLTLVIQNIQSNMENSIGATVGEVKKIAYAQNGKIADLEKSITKLSDTVESLVTEMKLLREQNS